MSIFEKYIALIIANFVTFAVIFLGAIMLISLCAYFLTAAQMTNFLLLVIIGILLKDKFKF